MGRQTNVKMHDGINLNVSIHDGGNPFWIVALHGVGESHKRHPWIGELFCQDFNIAQYDLRGHGQSGGAPGHGTFNLFKRDLDSLLTHLVVTCKMKKYILFGHSMGALICADWLQGHASDRPYPCAVFLNAPPVGFTGIVGKILQHSPFPALSKLNSFPLSFKIGGLVDTAKLSHDPDVKEEYHAGEDNHLKLHSKLLFDMVISSRRTFSRPIDPRCPAFVTVGSEDKIICVKSLIRYFKVVEKNFHLQVFDGAWHELHNEIKKYRLPYFEFIQTEFINFIEKSE